MRNFLIILVICVVSVVLAGLLYIYGPDEFHIAALTPATKGIPVTLITEGQNAVAQTERTNYRVQNDDQLQALWSLVYGENNSSIPNIDFTKEEVIAVFDGSHSTGGYKVAVQQVLDLEGTRMVTVLRTSPGATCRVSNKATSPFQIVRIPKTSLTFAHQDQTTVTACP